VKNTRIGQILKDIRYTGGEFMPRKAPKKYNVTVSYCERTPEEAARLEAQITDVIYKSKMISMQKQKEEAVST